MKPARYLPKLRLSGEKSFGTMRMIVTVGWAIYPLGYFLGYLNGAADAVTLNALSTTSPTL